MITKKIEKAVKEYMRLTAPANQAFGFFGGGRENPSAGQFRILPLVSYPFKGRLMIQSCLLRTYEDKQIGVLDWSLPVNETTLPAVLGVLAALGWDGRYWPEDPGWPDTEPKEAEGLKGLLIKTGIPGTLVFPPHDEKGSRVLQINVLKTNGDKFPLPMMVAESDRVEPTPEMEAKLRTIMALSPDDRKPAAATSEKSPESPREAEDTQASPAG